MEVALLPCGLSNVFAGGYALFHFWRGLCQTQTKPLSRTPRQSVVWVQNKAGIHVHVVMTDTLLRMCKYLRSFSNTDRINPFLCLSWSNTSSDRAIFSEYSSALVMRTTELRRLRVVLSADMGSSSPL